jgi:AsmA protein
VQGDAARFSLRSELAGVDMAGVGRDYLKIDTLVGTGSVSLDLASTGAQVGAIKRGLDGRASVALTDGALLGIDIWQTMMEGRARLTGPAAPPAPAEPRTSFQRIAVGGPVADAVMTTEEFSATLPFAALTGQGTIDLLTTALDLRASAGLIDGPTLQQDPVFAGFAGRQIPLTIGGTLAAPRVLPDVGALLSQAVSQRVDEEVEEAREEVREEVDEAVDEAREELQDRARERFRDLLD